MTKGDKKKRHSKNAETESSEKHSEKAESSSPRGEASSAAKKDNGEPSSPRNEESKEKGKVPTLVTPTDGGLKPTSKKSPRMKTPRGQGRDGQLFFNVIAGRSLTPCDNGRTTSDPYCKVYIGKEKKHVTNYVPKCLDPKWDPVGKLTVIEASKPVGEVRFQVWDHDLLFDDFMGELIFNVEELYDEVPRFGWFPVQSREGKKDKVEGEIDVQVIYIPSNIQMGGEGHEFLYPLHTLIRKGQLAPFEKMLEEGKVNLSLRDNKGLTALMVACQLGKVDFAQKLIYKKALLDDKLPDTSETALHVAVKADQGAALTLLIESGANLEAADNESNTPLHVAAALNRGKLCSILLSHGAIVNAKNELGDTPLHKAMEAKALETIDVLVHKGADVSLENNNGRSPGHLICEPEIGIAAQRVLMEAAGLHDHREWALTKTLKAPLHTITFNGTMYREWKKNPQFSVSTSEDAEVYVMIHYAHDHNRENQMEHIGFIVLNSEQGTYREPSYQPNLFCYGKKEPLPLEIKKDEFYTICPFAKDDTGTGYFTMIFISEKNMKCRELEQWATSIDKEGEWKGETAGGSQANETWTKNPRFILELPKVDGKLPVCIQLSQAKAALDLRPYDVIPYDFFIGYYVFDIDMVEIVAQVKKFKNARTVVGHFNFDTRKSNRFILVPCTHKQNEETSFVVRVYSTHEISLSSQ